MKICIANLEISNIKSAYDFFSRFGTAYIVNNKSEFQKNTDLLILPGNGTFKAGVRMLKKKKFDELFLDLVSTKTLIIGICLGMQLFFEKSEESYDDFGLGFFEGKVIEVKTSSCNLPLLGWYETESKKNLLLNKKNFYFNNKYSCCPKNIEYDMSYLNLIDCKMLASIKKKNIFGSQFHPEKSSKNGFNMIKKLIEDYENF